MKTLPLLVLAMSFSSLAYAQTGGVQGRIIDLDGTRLAGVTISIESARITQHFETKSDRNGTYSHIALPTGRYKLSMMKDGKSVSLDTRVTFGNVSTVDFDLRRLMPYDREQQHRVTLAGLTVPRKAQQEWRKAFDAEADLKKVQKHLEKAIEIAPDFEEALNDLGTVYYRKQQYEKAAELFERALKVNPDSFTAKVNFGGTLVSMKQYERALIENLGALTLRPDDALAHGQTGMCLFYLKRYEEAIPHFQRTKHSNPNSPILPGLFLASIYDLMGNNKAAIAEYEEFLNAHPRDPASARVERRLHVLKSANSTP